MTRSIARASIALLSISLLGSGCASDVCYVNSPEEYAAISDTCLEVFVTGWPTDELELTSSEPERKVYIGAVEGVSGSEPFQLRRIFTDGVGVVIGKATEEAELRDVVVPGVQAPSRTIEPRVFEEPCPVWAPDDQPDSMTGIGLGVVPNGSLHVTAEVQLHCLNVSLTFDREVVASQADMWSAYSLTIDENAQPAGLAQVTGSASLTLFHLQQLGVRLKSVRLIAVGDGVYESYVAWLDETTFSGRVERCSVDAEGLVDSCSRIDVN